MIPVSESLIADLVDIIHRNVEDAIIREDIYHEFIGLFNDETILEGGLGEDDVFDHVFKDMINESDSDEEDK